jgi:hypothetical protein
LQWAAPAAVCRRAAWIFFSKGGIEGRAAPRVYFTGKEKKPEVGEKRVYRISRKFFGFIVFLSDKNLEKKSSIYTKTT